MSTARHSDRGVTLAEILFTLLFIALAVLAVIGIQTFALKAQRVSKERQGASLLATSLMWRTVDSVKTDFTIPVDMPAPESAGTDLDPQARFTYQVQELSVAPPLTSDQLRQIKVTVFWQSDRGPQSFELTTKVKAP